MIEELHPPLPVGDPHDLPHRISHQAELRLAFLERGFGGPQAVDHRLLVARKLVAGLGLATQPHHVGDILDAVDDEGDLAVGTSTGELSGLHQRSTKPPSASRTV